MVKPRFITLPISNLAPIKFSVTEAAGHGAFVALALSYLETDVLNLRLMACTGIFLNIMFQYYRSVPLWIPLRWNFLFLAINAGMIIISLKEQSEADSIPAEMKKTYDAVFKSLNKVDFMRMMHNSEELKLDPGKFLVTKNGERNSLYLVQKGVLDVMQDGIKIAEIRENQFVGERSWKARTLEGTVAQDGDSPELAKERGLRDVVARTECVVYTWSFDILDEMLKEEPRIALAFERLMSSDLNKKMLQVNTASMKYRYILKGALLDNAVNDARRKVLQQYRSLHGVTEAEHLSALKEVGWTVQKFNENATPYIPESVSPAKL